MKKIIIKLWKYFYNIMSQKPVGNQLSNQTPTAKIDPNWLASVKSSFWKIQVKP